MVLSPSDGAHIASEARVLERNLEPVRPLLLRSAPSHLKKRIIPKQHNTTQRQQKDDENTWYINLHPRKVQHNTPQHNTTKQKDDENTNINVHPRKTPNTTHQKDDEKTKTSITRESGVGRVGDRYLLLQRGLGLQEKRPRCS